MTPDKQQTRTHAYSLCVAATYEVFGKLESFGTPFLVANFKQIGMPLPVGVRGEDDLLARAPQEIRSENSLHLIGPNDVASWIELFEVFRGHNALIVVFSANSRDQLIEAVGVYWGWYVSPQTVKLVFEEGPNRLIKEVANGTRAIMVGEAYEDSCRVYSLLDLPLDEGGVTLSLPGIFHP